jgi:hypothetical protein
LIVTLGAIETGVDFLHFPPSILLFGVMRDIGPKLEL